MANRDVGERKRVSRTPTSSILGALGVLAVQILPIREQAFHCIRPDHFIITFLKECYGSAQAVVKNPCGFATLGGVEGWIEFAKEFMGSVRARVVDHEVKPRGADQIQAWQIVPGSQDTADRDVSSVEFPQSLQQDFWRTRPHGGIGKGHG